MKWAHACMLNELMPAWRQAFVGIFWLCNVFFLVPTAGFPDGHHGKPMGQLGGAPRPVVAMQPKCHGHPAQQVACLEFFAGVPPKQRPMAAWVFNAQHFKKNCCQWGQMGSRQLIQPWPLFKMVQKGGVVCKFAAVLHMGALSNRALAIPRRSRTLPDQQGHFA